MLDRDVVSQEPRPLGPGMGYQGLFPVQFQSEGLSQEPGQVFLDYLGLFLCPGESQQMIIGLCRSLGYAGVE
jgi:hypothetical protein